MDILQKGDGWAAIMMLIAFDLEAYFNSKVVIVEKNNGLILHDPVC